MKFLKKILGTIYGTLTTAILLAPLGMIGFAYAHIKETTSLGRSFFERAFFFGLGCIGAVPLLFKSLLYSIPDSFRQGLRTGDCMRNRGWLQGLAYPFKTLPVVAKAYFQGESRTKWAQLGHNRDLENSAKVTLKEHLKERIELTNLGIENKYIENKQQPPVVPSSIVANITDYALDAEELKADADSRALAEFKDLNQDPKAVTRQLQDISRENHRLSYSQRFSLACRGLFSRSAAQARRQNSTVTDVELGNTFSQPLLRRNN